jgi:phage replication-related protein YjqB (UPF0714/DUF867 family)
MDNTDRYNSYTELRRYEQEGHDYNIKVRYGRSGIAVMAPHGGDIEPGTSEIADAIASADHTFYSFEGAKESENRRLHITSTRFDEPLGADVACHAQVVVSIHGCKGKEAMVCLGGLDGSLKASLKTALGEAGFAIGERAELSGTSCLNLCNRGLGGVGVQLEISSGLRRTMFQDLTRDGRRKTTEVFKVFVSAFRKALFDYRLNTI